MFVLTESQYNRLVGYSYVVCKDPSIKKDLVHDAWIAYQLYSKKRPEGEDLMKLLQFHIKQALIKLKCKQDKDGKWVKKPEILALGNMRMFENIPDTSNSSLEANTGHIGRKIGTTIPFMQNVFKTTQDKSKTNRKYYVKRISK